MIQVGERKSMEFKKRCKKHVGNSFAKTLAARGLEELRVNLLLKENSYVSQDRKKI